MIQSITFIRGIVRGWSRGPCMNFFSIFSTDLWSVCVVYVVRQPPSDMAGSHWMSGVCCKRIVANLPHPPIARRRTSSKRVERVGWRVAGGGEILACPIPRYIHLPLKQVIFEYLYLCICTFVFLCICVFVYLYICVFVYFSSNWMLLNPGLPYPTLPPPPPSTGDMPHGGRDKQAIHGIQGIQGIHGIQGIQGRTQCVDRYLTHRRFTC